ncbi:MAG: LacI family DNA-binding transcriptional regulator [Eubacterium sp.]|nr:LacI family DNA-binding transcriptional regulator [Eubacterium sp.]
MGRKISIKKLSEVTGFSPATISNALNKKPGVKKETADLIFKAAEDLGYLDGSTSIRKIRFVVYHKNGFIIDNSNFHNFLMEGVSAEASENGLDTIISQLNCGSEGFDTLLDQIKSETDCGIVLLATEMDQEAYRLFEECKSNIVLLDGWSRDENFDSVSIANFNAAYKAVQYLYKKGHRKIGRVKSRFRIQAFREREQGYRQAMEDLGLSVREDWEFLAGTTEQEAQLDMGRILDQGRIEPTALFVDDDRIAYGVMQAIQMRGLRIPEDISILGFDDLPSSSLTRPALSTISVYKQEMGRCAVRCLLSGMEHKEREGYLKIELSTEIAERKSVAQLI